MKAWKTAALAQFKLADSGAFSALFAPFNVVDKQGDLTLPGAFGEQQVIISAYGHGSWDGALPVGKGRIFESDIGGIVEGQFFLDTQSGAETYKTIKNLGDLQQFSYALPEIDYEMRTQDGQSIRVLKKITVNEVSPVLMGAGIGTRLLDIKSGMTLLDELEAVAGCARSAVEKLKNATDLRAADGRGPGAERMKRASTLKGIFDELARDLARLEAVGTDEHESKIDGAMVVESIRFALESTARR